MSYNSEWDLADHSHAASQHPSPRPRAHASPPPLAPRIARHSSADNVAREFAREGREGRRRWAATPTGYGSDAGFGVRAMSTFSLPDLAASSSAQSPEIHHDSSAPDESSSDAPRPASDPVRYLSAATLAPADLDGGPPVRNDTMTPLPHSEERLGAMSLAGLHGQAAVTPQPARPCHRGFFSSEDTATTTDAGRGHRGPLWGRGGGLSFESQASGHSAGRAGGESYHSDVDIFHGNAVFRHEPVPDSPVAQHAGHRDSAPSTPASLPPFPASAESPGPEQRGADEQETAKDRRRRLLAIPVFPGAPAAPVESLTPPVARAAPVPADEGVSTVDDAQPDPDAEVAVAARCPVPDLPDAAARDDSSVSSDDEAHVHRRARAATPAPPTPPLARDDAFPPVDGAPTAGLTQRRNDAAEVVRPIAEPDTPTTPAPRTLGRGRACQDLLWWSLWAYLGLQSREAEGPAPTTTAACTAGRYACFAFVYGAACRVVRRSVEYAVAPAQWACEMAVAALRCGAETMLRWPLAAACALQCVLVAQSYADSAQCLAVAWAAGRVASALDDGPDPQTAGSPCPCDEGEPAGAGAPMGRRNTSLPHPPPNAALPQPPLLSTTEALTLAQSAPGGPSIVGDSLPAFAPRPGSVPRVLEMS